MVGVAASGYSFHRTRYSTPLWGAIMTFHTIIRIAEHPPGPIHRPLLIKRRFHWLPCNESRWPVRGSLDWFNTRTLCGTSAWQFGTQSLEYFVRCNRRFVNAHSYSIKNSVGNRRYYWIQGALTCFLATKGTFSVWNFNQDRLNFWRIQSCR